MAAMVVGLANVLLVVVAAAATSLEVGLADTVLAMAAAAVAAALFFSSTHAILCRLVARDDTTGGTFK